MPTRLEETRLPGIGTKFTIRTGEGSRLTVILHNDGKRELYYFAPPDPLSDLRRRSAAGSS